MTWIVCFYTAIVMLSVSCVWALYLRKSRYKRNRVFTPFYVLFGGVAAASLIIFIPIYMQMFETERFSIGKVFLLSIHNAIRLFIVDGEFTIISESMSNVMKPLADIYAIFAAVLFVVAPFMTFGFVLSFFKNVSAYRRYYIGYFKDTYIFSELNERSLALAQSLKENDTQRMIIFTDVFEANEEASYELTAQANEIGAILFKKDIAVVNFGFHSKSSQMGFFIIGQDDDENVKQALLLQTRYKEKDNVSLYVFTTSVNSELLLNGSADSKIRLRRINEVQSLVYRHLYDTGTEIFEKALKVEDKKEISAVVIGLGEYGKEIVKALSWFGQMDGYDLKIHSYDKDIQADSHFYYECPELMDKSHNHDFHTEGEAHYSITIQSGVDVETKEFLESVDSLQDISYIFISLGNDEINIRTAVKLRSWLLKSGVAPKIDVIVNNSDKKQTLGNVTNYSGQEYNINFIGDIRTCYSEKVIFESDIEALALQRHLKWGDEESFWKYEYNYRSSIASAIHRKMKIECGIPGADKLPEERSEEERWNLRELEHKRWNAYMRSEGYTYAPKRNNLAKTHHCLVPFKDLSLQDQMKDDD